jgi:protein O-GlcNAc transferase
VLCEFLPRPVVQSPQIDCYTFYRFLAPLGYLSLLDLVSPAAGTLSMRSRNTLAPTRYAVSSKSFPFLIAFSLMFAISALTTLLACAAQTGSSPASQGSINEQAQAAYRAGTTAAANNDLQMAEVQFEKVVRLVPQIEEGHSALGAVLMRLGKLPEAIKELEKAHELKPSDSSVQINLALAYEQTGASKKAIVLFKSVEDVMQHTPGSDSASASALPSYVLAAYARSLAAAGQLAAATAKMKAAVAESPQIPDLHDALGSLYAQQSNWPSAVSEFQKVIQLNPKAAAAHLHLGAALLAQQQPSSAIQELTLAAQMLPENALAATELGKAYAANNEDDKAVAEFQRVIGLDPGSAEAKYQLARALQRTGHGPEAIPLLRQVVQADPKNAEAAASLGLALLLAGNAKDAIPFLQRTLQQNPAAPTAPENLAAAYLQMNEIDEAIRVLTSGLEIDPQSFQLHYNLGLALKLKDDNAAAIPELEAASRLNPSAHEPHYTLGILYMQDGRYDDAARELSLAMKLHPDNPDGWATLGSLYRKMDKLPEAAAALREAIRQLPGQPESHLTLAAVLAQQGNYAEAAAERKIGADLEREVMHRQRAIVSTNSGNALLQKGQVADAIERFQEALSEDPNYAEAHRGLANALERQGKNAEAAAERQKAEDLSKPKS